MIGILGAGALGRLWAALLPAGNAAFFARSSQPDAGQISYRFQTLNGSETVVEIPVLGAADGAQLVLVTTKAGDAVNAIDSIAHRIPHATPIVLFQNGLGSQQAVADRWPNRPILAASTTEGANRPVADLLIHAGAGETWVGPMTASAPAALDDAVAQLQAAGLCCHGDRDILSRLWQKLVINAGINPYTAILDCTNGEILSAPLYQDTIDELCQELANLMSAAGQGNASPGSLRQRIEAVARQTSGNTSSMRADRRHGRRTEIDFINGYLVRHGNCLGIPTPVNQMLTERVQQTSFHEQEQADGQPPFQNLHSDRR